MSTEIKRNAKGLYQLRSSMTDELLHDEKWITEQEAKRILYSPSIDVDFFRTEYVKLKAFLDELSPIMGGLRHFSRISIDEDGASYHTWEIGRGETWDEYFTISWDDLKQPKEYFVKMKQDEARQKQEAKELQAQNDKEKLENAERELAVKLKEKYKL